MFGVNKCPNDNQGPTTRSTTKAKSLLWPKQTTNTHELKNSPATTNMRGWRLFVKDCDCYTREMTRLIESEEAQHV